MTLLCDWCGGKCESKETGRRSESAGDDALSITRPAAVNDDDDDVGRSCRCHS